MLETSGSVRADLVGGTLDLSPLNIQIPEVVTINMALSLKAKVVIESHNFDGVIIESLDYEKIYQYDSIDFTKDKLYFTDHFEKMTFVAQILQHCQLTSKVKITLSSGAPAGSGLGGSSTMGVTLYKAIKAFKKEEFNRFEAKDEVQQMEAGILKAGVAGYQDYYPALFGGVLALHPRIGREEIEQLCTNELKEFLEDNISLIFSGVSRDSGINNWEVYKQFYDKNPIIHSGLSKIAQISMKAYQAIKSCEYLKFIELMIEEGEQRSKLFPSILGPKIQCFKDDMISKKLISGVKVCGAGGGGCFLALHPGVSRDKLETEVLNAEMQLLEFKVSEVIN